MKTIKLKKIKPWRFEVSSSKTEDLRSAERIHLLEHMFQMTAFAPQTHLKPTREAVTHPDTLFLPDGTNLLGDGHFQFSNGLRTIDSHTRGPSRTPRDINLVSEGQRRSFGTCALINVSFELTSDLQFFFFLSYQLPGNVIFWGVSCLSNKSLSY